MSCDTRSSAAELLTKTLLCEPTAGIFGSRFCDGRIAGRRLLGHTVAQTMRLAGESASAQSPWPLSTSSLSMDLPALP
jgi:hypothetical protein